MSIVFIVLSFKTKLLLIAFIDMKETTTYIYAFSLVALDFVMKHG